VGMTDRWQPSPSSLSNLISRMHEGWLLAQVRRKATWSALMAESMTTQAPPRSSAPGGRYTKAGRRYVRSASTIRDPA
jgi:hypothetical protein